MARQARSVQKTSLFSIRQQTDTDIFRNQKDREMFVEIIQKAKVKFGFDLYGYCLLDNNAFWLIIDVKKRSLATIMQSICISYALYREDETKLFKNRYLSKPLYDFSELEDELQNLQSDRRYKQNSFCYFDPKTNQPHAFIAMFNPHMSVEKIHATHFDNDGAYQKIQKLSDSNFDSIEQRNNKIKELYANYNFTQKQLADYFKLSVSSVSKILSA